MKCERTHEIPPRVLSYTEADRTPKPFSVPAFCGGFLAPYAYAAVSLFVIGLFTSRTNGVIAFYHLDPPVVVALAAFPVLVWWVRRRVPHRGFLRGVVAGVVSLPLLAVVALAISFRRP